MTIASTLQASPIDDMQEVGQAKLEILFWDIYQSTLYSPNGKFVEGEYPLALKIQYLRKISAKDLIKRTAKEWDKLGLNEADYAPWLVQVGEIWPDIKKGDELLLKVDANKQSTFYFNQTEIGKIDDTDFGQSFLAIWLDEKCSFPELRLQLIGEKDA